jgi:integrase
VGRKRKDDSLRLPRRTYVRAGTFYYAHADTGRWENLGKDHAAACKRADHYNDPTGTYGTMTWFLDQFIIDCEQRVVAKDLSERSVGDYRDCLPRLKAFFGDMLPTEVTGAHVAEYLDIGAKHGRPVRANRERAALSSCMSWMIRSSHGGLQINPCMRHAGVVRNSETPRELYVENAWYHEVYARAPGSVRLAMELVYRTLQRPEVDVLAWTPANIQKKAGARVLHFRQSKTQRVLDIGLVGRLEELIDSAIGAVPQLRQPIVHTREGEGYTYTGLSSMLRRVQVKVRKEVPALAAMPSWGFRDLKGKGATDMWLSGEPIERIQMLCGHAKKSTTEIYVKARWRETVAPNSLKIGA